VEKDFSYILHRVLGIKPNDYWVYTTLDGFDVIQHRLHVNLSDSDFIDLVFQNGTPVDSVSLRINSYDNYLPGRYIELQNAPTTFRNEFGDTVWRVHIKNVFKKEFEATTAGFLQEIIVRMKTDDSPVVLRRPLKMVVFKQLSRMSDELLPDDEDIILPFRIEPIAAYKWRMVIDLSNLKSKGKIPFMKDRVIIKPNGYSFSSGLDISKIQLVNLYQTDRPVFLNFGRDLLKRWGVPEENRLGAEGEVQWPQVLAYLPFNTMDPKLHKIQGRSFVIFKNDAGIIYSETYKNREVQDRGVLFKSNYSFLRTISGEHGLCLEGLGDWVDIDIPISMTLPENPIFFMGVFSGEEQIQEMKLILPFENRLPMQVTIKPNEAKRLLGNGRIKMVIRSEVSLSKSRKKIFKDAMNNAYPVRQPT
jgi:hypothetical protein